MSLWGIVIKGTLLLQAAFTVCRGMVYNTDICSCPCSSANLTILSDAAVTITEAKEKAVELEKFLTVDKQTTSVISRSKHSQPDQRASSKSIGVVSVIFIGSVFTIICLSDVISCERKSLKKTKREATEVKATEASRNVKSEITSDRNKVQIKERVPFSKVINSSSNAFLTIRKMSLTKLLHEFNKYFLLFPNFADKDDRHELLLRSFPKDRMVDPLLQSISVSAGPSCSRTAGVTTEVRREYSNEGLQIEDCRGDYEDKFGVGGLHAPYKCFSFSQNSEC